MFRPSVLAWLAVLGLSETAPRAQAPGAPRMSQASQPSEAAQASRTLGAVDPVLLGELRWRMIGPHRASRTRAITGVVQQPHTFYIGVSNGGVWKTTDAGRTWLPIFDRASTGSIGALAVAPSDPRVLYVGSGEAQQRPDLSVGNGLYKSTDAGRTWTHLPQLRDTQQIGALVIDPTDPNRLFVAALGHDFVRPAHPPCSPRNPTDRNRSRSGTRRCRPCEIRRKGCDRELVH